MSSIRLFAGFAARSSRAAAALILRLDHFPGDTTSTTPAGNILDGGVNAAVGGWSETRKFSHVLDVMPKVSLA